MTKAVNILIITGQTPLTPRQLHGGMPMLQSGERSYHFFFNTMPDDVRPDVVVVRNRYLKQPTHFDVAPSNTLLMLSEPSSVCHFPNDYVRQFGRVHSCQTEIKGGNVSYGPAALPWFVGYVRPRGQQTEFSLTYDDISVSPLPTKTKVISLITSDKSFTSGHVDRLRFVRKIKQVYGDSVDVFGRGFKSVGDKWDALAPYKYTIVIENCQAPHYWTEKLSDAMLAGCHIVYYGATDVTDYFPSASITPIDINDFVSARQKIDSLLAEDPYGGEADALYSARSQVLDTYNIFRLIANYADRMDVDAPCGNGVTLRPAGTNLRNVYNHLVGWPLCRLTHRLLG